MFLIYSFSIYSRCVLHTQTLKLNQQRIKCTLDIRPQRRLIVVFGVGIQIEIFGWSFYFFQHFVSSPSEGKVHWGGNGISIDLKVKERPCGSNRLARPRVWSYPPRDLVDVKPFRHPTGIPTLLSAFAAACSSKWN